ncbi:MAG TPA: glycosyltransferase [Vicinamibacterales bacterium]|nr:glycosyltransferase [Vicinamibacterales bacterium]
MRILHAIHDFLPRHQAGSEIYAFELCRAQRPSHDVTVLCADFDPSRAHGTVDWRVHRGVPVVEIVNNWVCGSFEETYRPPLVRDRIAHVLRALQPDVVHVHNLQNLSFDLPAMARANGARVVATLHDYTLVCASGGQRIHRADRYVCRTIDTDRCARCFRESIFFAHMSLGRIAAATNRPGLLMTAARAARRWFPALSGTAARAAASLPLMTVTRADIDARLVAARRLMDDVDVFVAPSKSVAEEYCALGLPASKLRVSDYGFPPLREGTGARRSSRPLRIGFIGTLVWHKGAHVLIDAVRGLPADAYELTVFGDPDVFPDYAAGLRAQAAGLPVRFAGAVQRERIADAYAQIDLLVVPSLWLENSPLVIHEAFMARVPVVAARIGGIAGLITDGVNGLLYDSDQPREASVERSLRAVLAELIARFERLDALAAAAPPVKSIDQDAREWDAIYAEVA